MLSEFLPPVNQECWPSLTFYKKGISLYTFFLFKWIILLWKIIWRFPKILKTEPSHDPAIPLLGVYPKKWNAGSQRGIFTPMFLTPLFTITKR